MNVIRQYVGELQIADRLAGCDGGGDRVRAREIGTRGGLALGPTERLRDGEQGWSYRTKIKSSERGAGYIAAAPVIQRGRAILISTTRINE